MRIERNSIRIPEATGLHLAGSDILEGRRGRTSTKRIGGHNPVRLGTGKCIQNLRIKHWCVDGKLRLRNIFSLDGMMHALRLPEFQGRRLNPGRYLHRD